MQGFLEDLLEKSLEQILDESLEELIQKIAIGTHRGIAGSDAGGIARGITF